MMMVYKMNSQFSITSMLDDINKQSNSIEVNTDKDTDKVSIIALLLEYSYTFIPSDEEYMKYLRAGYTALQLLYDAIVFCVEYLGRRFTDEVLEIKEILARKL